MSNEVIKTKNYRRKVRSWIMYDWANSSFATTIMAAVLPPYFSKVAAATLATPALATGVWSIGTSISLLIVAILSPTLGTLSDITRGKKKFLAGFMLMGVISTGLFFLIERGDWIPAILLYVIARIGFSGGNVFYDSLLPHVAVPGDQDRVSSLGFAWGYLGGGVLLALNVVMLTMLPSENWGTLGPRLCFLSVALWWGLFSIPIFKNIKEPATAAAEGKKQPVLKETFARIIQIFSDISKYKQLFIFLIAYLIYIDGVNTIISLSTIYGSELGLGMTELILALLLVQILGLPFSILYGKLTSNQTRLKQVLLAFLFLNMISLPATALLGRIVLPDTVVGVQPETPQAASGFLDPEEGKYEYDNKGIKYVGDWNDEVLKVKGLFSTEKVEYTHSTSPDSAVMLPLHGKQFELEFAFGPGYSDVDVFSGAEFVKTIEAPEESSGKMMFTNPVEFELDKYTTHLIRIESKDGGSIGLRSVNILPPQRISNIGYILVVLAIVEIITLLIAIPAGLLFLKKFALKMTTKRAIMIAIVTYCIIAFVGFSIDSVMDFFVLAWMVACVQGGIQALSRSLYSSMVPESKSGEFFGFFGIMGKFASIVGPIVFGTMAILTGSSRFAVLIIGTFFIIGIVLLSKLDVEKGREAVRR